jgi:hypothetical protein
MTLKQLERECNRLRVELERLDARVCEHARAHALINADWQAVERFIIERFGTLAQRKLPPVEKE